VAVVNVETSVEVVVVVVELANDDAEVSFEIGSDMPF